MLRPYLKAAKQNLSFRAEAADAFFFAVTPVNASARAEGYSAPSRVVCAMNLSSNDPSTTRPAAGFSTVDFFRVTPPPSPPSGKTPAVPH
jgi:hypothetical protein